MIQDTFLPARNKGQCNHRAFLSPGGRRGWPEWAISLGAGFTVGEAFGNCTDQRDLNKRGKGPKDFRLLLPPPAAPRPFPQLFSPFPEHLPGARTKPNWEILTHIFQFRWEPSAKALSLDVGIGEGAWVPRLWPKGISVDTVRSRKRRGHSRQQATYRVVLQE